MQKQRSKKQRHRRLTTESLESRKLFHAASILGAGGDLVITADPNGGAVEISEYFSSGQRVTEVESRQIGQTPLRTRFLSNAVQRIEFIGSDKIDSLHNLTSKSMTANGFGGDDLLVGGSGDDVLSGGEGDDHVRGNAGNDIIAGDSGADLIQGGRDDDRIEAGPGNDIVFGGHGADVIDGQSGEDELHGGRGQDTVKGGADDDRIWGDRGKDKLHGGDGADRIWGGAGNDRLYGENGIDLLFGQDGNDGLFGGFGETDLLVGGDGADRFLQPGTGIGEDNLPDAFTSIDTRIHFTDSDANWSNEEVEWVDTGFQLVHDLTNDNALLQHADGSSLLLVRDDLNLPCNGIACNGNQIITMGTESLTTELNAIRTITHEIGHNWDSVGENSTVASFRDASGWIEFPGVSALPGYTQAGGAWWYLDGTEFARDHAMSNPREDFASTFSALVLHQNGLVPRGAFQATGGFDDWLNDGDPMPLKAQIVDDWIATLV